jgi:hypothetical protein
MQVVAAAAEVAPFGVAYRRQITAGVRTAFTSLGSTLERTHQRLATSVFKLKPGELRLGTFSSIGPVSRPGTSALESASQRWVSRFWNKSTEFQGIKVYQRDDLIDLVRVDDVGRTNLQRMHEGLAPIGPDGKPLGIHHLLQTPDGPVAEISYTLHTERAGVVHINPNTIPSGINRTDFRAWREAYWADRARQLAPGGP